MSRSNATSRIVCISNGKTYSCILQCQQGDINQFYNDTGDISPSFSQSNFRRLLFLAYDSDAGGEPADIDSKKVKWSVNGVELDFDSSGASTNSFGGTTGHFVRATMVTIVNNNRHLIPILTVVKDLLSINESSSFSIMAKATISVENTSATLSASFPVTIGKGEVNSKRVRIQSPEDYQGIPFTISRKEERDASGNLVDGSFCKLEAIVISSDIISSSSITYEWYQQVSGAWKSLGLYDKVITVTESMVEGSALFKCVVKKDGQEFGSDIQNVNDKSDPWQVYVNCVDGEGSDAKPAIEVCYKGSGVPIIYRPYIKNAGSDTIINGDTKVTINGVEKNRATFKMSLFDSVGTLLNRRPKSGDTNPYNPPFLNDEAKTVFVINEPFVSAHAGIDLQVDVDIIDNV